LYQNRFERATADAYSTGSSQQVTEKLTPVAWKNQQGLKPDPFITLTAGLEVVP
jgi:hypothetical protein